jgi:hypothetical protein
MALSSDKLYQPLNDFFLSRFATNATSPVIFRFDKFGSVIGEMDFMDPMHPGLGYNFNLAREVFSDLVNSIPHEEADGISVVFMDTDIDDLYYFQLLQPSCLPTPPNADAQIQEANRRRFEALKAEAEHNWSDVFAESSSGLMIQYKPSLATPVNWYDPGNGSWVRHSLEVGGAPSGDPAVPATPVWRLRIGNETLRNILAAEHSPPPITPFKPKPALRAGVRVMAAHEVARVAPVAVRAGAPMRAASFATPPRIATHPVGLPAADAPLGRARFADLGKERRGGLRVNLDERLMVKQALDTHAPARPSNTDRATISFEYCPVRVERPWYTTAFINDDSWAIPNLPEGGLSAADDPRHLSLMPTGFIAVKNLSIKADWTAQDIENARNALAFGPFRVDGEMANGAVGHEGIQIVGWFLQKMPALPPKPWNPIP